MESVESDEKKEEAVVEGRVNGAFVERSIYQRVDLPMDGFNRRELPVLEVDKAREREDLNDSNEHLMVGSIEVNRLKPSHCKPQLKNLTSRHDPLAGEQGNRMMPEEKDSSSSAHRSNGIVQQSCSGNHSAGNDLMVGPDVRDQTQDIPVRIHSVKVQDDVFVTDSTANGRTCNSLGYPICIRVSENSATSHCLMNSGGIRSSQNVMDGWNGDGSSVTAIPFRNHTIHDHHVQGEQSTLLVGQADMHNPMHAYRNAHMDAVMDDEQSSFADEKVIELRPESSLPSIRSRWTEILKVCHSSRTLMAGHSFEEADLSITVNSKNHFNPIGHKNASKGKVIAKVVHGKKFPMQNEANGQGNAQTKKQDNAHLFVASSSSGIVPCLDIQMQCMPYEEMLDCLEFLLFMLPWIRWRRLSLDVQGYHYADWQILQAVGPFSDNEWPQSVDDEQQYFHSRQSNDDSEYLQYAIREYILARLARHVKQAEITDDKKNMHSVNDIISCKLGECNEQQVSITSRSARNGIPSLRNASSKGTDDNWDSFSLARIDELELSFLEGSDALLGLQLLLVAAEPSKLIYQANSGYWDSQSVGAVASFLQFQATYHQRITRSKNARCSVIDLMINYPLGLTTDTDETDMFLDENLDRLCMHDDVPQQNGMMHEQARSNMHSFPSHDNRHGHVDAANDEEQKETECFFSEDVHWIAELCSLPKNHVVNRHRQDLSHNQHISKPINRKVQMSSNEYQDDEDDEEEGSDDVFSNDASFVPINSIGKGQSATVFGSIPYADTSFHHHQHPFNPIASQQSRHRSFSTMPADMAGKALNITGRPSESRNFQAEPNRFYSSLQSLTVSDEDDLGQACFLDCLQALDAIGLNGC